MKIIISNIYNNFYIINNINNLLKENFFYNLNDN